MTVSPRSGELKPAAANPVLLRDRIERLLWHLDQQATKRLIAYGPQGRPLVVFSDHVSAAILQLRRSRRARAARDLDTATSIESAITAVGRVLPLNQKPAEIVAFLEWTRRFAPHRLCEIGVESGGTHLLFKRALPQIELTVAIDLFVRHKAHLRYFAPPGQRSLFVDASSYDPRTVDRVKQALDGQPLDLLFIDGDHSFAGAAADFELYRPLVRPGGIIAFHDIVEDSFIRTGRRARAYVGEVPQLWRQIRAHYPEHREFVESWTQDGYGIGAIVYDPAVAVRLEPPAHH
jgi:cephalosporin hydroxylase